MSATGGQYEFAERIQYDAPAFPELGPRLGPKLDALFRVTDRYDGAPNPDFILNQSPYDRAQILLADRNFGCGSSRERAPKALREFGFRAVLAPSFGGIFFNNCYRNGIVPVELPIETIRAIRDEVEATGGHGLVTVDLEKLTVNTLGGQSYFFEAPQTLRQMILEGMDEIAHTLAKKATLDAFRLRDRQLRPWAY